MSSRAYLSDGWELGLLNNNGQSVPFDANKKIKTAIPGTVHTDLLAAKIIDDPYYSDNELRQRWISNCDWIYTKQFDLPEGMNAGSINIVFEGVDTISEIELNGVILGNTTNMFLKYEYDLAGIVKDKENILTIKIFSGVKYGKLEEAKYGRLPVALDPERVYIRKAQYSFGWDWGPSFPTMGLWRDVYLDEKADYNINDVSFTTVSLKENFAEVKISYQIESNSQDILSSQISLFNQKHKFERTVSSITNNHIEETLKIENPDLWWPNGMGLQNLYNLVITVGDENSVTFEKKVGIRTVALELENDKKETFRFVVNGKIIFAKGVNWIPGDSFLPRVTLSKYKTLLTLVKNANMNIVRVWGGGIYENDEFYDLCDELGLLVWQDFMFACGAYPEHQEFIDNVKNEIYHNVIRLRTHPSIAIWCGNNENEWIWSFSQPTSYTEMPGYKLFSDIIPTELKKLDPSRPYWESSPFGFDKDPNSQTSGNRHQWNIWSHWIDYSEVEKDNSLFVTEFGFQGPANKDTFKKFLPAANCEIQDPVFEFHNKQIEGPDRVMRFLYAHLPIPKTWEEYLYLAQLNQALALKTCLEHWGTNQITNGSIIWQINDTWPVTSWALVDSEMTKKISYHFVKKVFQPESLVFRRNGNDIKLLFKKKSEVFSGKAEVAFIDAASGSILMTKEFPINTDQSSIMELTVFKRDEYINAIMVATLYDNTEKIIDRNYYITKRWKHVKLAGAKLLVQPQGNSVKVSSDTPVFFVDLYSPGIEFDKRGVIILPGEMVSFKAESYEGDLDSTQLKIFILNDFLQS